MKIKKTNFSDLKIHPKNQEIYCETEADEELIRSIEENGLLSNLVVDDNNEIISGARRFLAIKRIIEDSPESKEHYEEMDVFQRSFKDEGELISFIVESNLNREKRWDQKVREGWAIHETVKNGARYDQFKGLKHVDVVPEKIPGREKDGTEEKGETYDRVARRVGLPNGKAYMNYSKVLRASDDLAKEGQSDHSKWLNRLASKSLQSALFVAKESKFDLLDTDSTKSKEKIVAFRKGQSKPPKDSFSNGQWMSSMTDLLKQVIDLKIKDVQTFNTLCKELKQDSGELLIIDQEGATHVKLEVTFI